MSSLTDIGIDFGTTFSSLCYCATDFPLFFELDDDPCIPTTLFLTTTECYIGHTANRCFSTGLSGAYFYEIKRWVGTTTENFDDRMKKIRPDYSVVLKAPDILITGINKGLVITLSVAQLIATFLKCLVHLFSKQFTCTPGRIVVSVPAYYNNLSRVLMSNIGESLQLNFSRIVNEPTAAALSELDLSKDQTIVIYDFGGGTFDISVAKYTKGFFVVLATDGDPVLGGRDIDRSIAEVIRSRCKFPTVNVVDEINEHAQYIKIRICVDSQEEHFINLSNGDSFALNFSVDQLNNIARPYIIRTINLLKSVLSSITDIGNLTINLVGGSSALPEVSKMISAAYPKALVIRKNDFRVTVARGCLKLITLSDATPPVILLDSLAHPLSSLFKYNEPIVVIANDLTVPVSVKKAAKISVGKDSTISLYEGESVRYFENDLIFRGDYDISTIAVNTGDAFYIHYGFTSVGIVEVFIGKLDDSKRVRIPNNISTNSAITIPNYDYRDSSRIAEDMAKIDAIMVTIKCEKELFSELATLTTAKQLDDFLIRNKSISGKDYPDYFMVKWGIS